MKGLDWKQLKDLGKKEERRTIKGVIVLSIVLIVLVWLIG